MKTLHFFQRAASIILAGTTLLSTQLPADAADAPAKTKQTQVPKTVAAGLKKLKLTAYDAKQDKFAPAKANSKAQYYIYMQSASTCGPCQGKMPAVVEAYKEMREDGRVEIILVCFDKNDAAMQGFLKKFNAEFPSMVNDTKALTNLPNFKRAGCLPSMKIVDAKGNIIVENFGDINEWKSHTIEK